jgi:hypothetical protein
MFGMSEYLMIAHEVEKARQLSRKTREDHRGKERASAGSTARQANTQERRSRDE